MDKWIKIGLLVIVLLALTACGAEEAAGTNGAESEAASAPEAADSTGSQEQDREQLRTDFGESALPPESQLMLGTLLLEDTEFAVGKDLAADLVPYWKVYQTLQNSDTTAPEELAAIIAQIQELMTADQVNTIAGLELTQEDLMAYVSEAGLLEGMRPEGTFTGDGTQTNRPEGMPEGMGPGGGQGGGPGAGAEGFDADPSLMATMEARRAEMGNTGNPGGNRMALVLLDAVIEMLEARAGE